MPAITPKFFRLCFIVLAALATGLSVRADVVPGWLMVSLAGSESLLCSNENERDSLVKAGWKIEVAAGVNSEGGEGAAPLHRLSRATKSGTDRLLETDVTRLPDHEKAGYQDEGIVGFVADSDGPGRIAVLQYAKGNRKIWIATPDTELMAANLGWKKQGVHFWLFPAPTAEKPAK